MMIKPNEKEIQQTAALLRRWKIYSASETHRLRLAHLVHQTGQTLGDEELRLLLAEARDVQGARRPLGLIVNWLSDGSWVQILEDLRSNGPLNQPKYFTHRTWVPPEEWKEEVDRHKILSVALGDRHSAEVVASRFGLRIDEVRDIVNKHGRAVFGDLSVDRWLGLVPPPAPFTRNDKRG